MSDLVYKEATEKHEQFKDELVGVMRRFAVGESPMTNDELVAVTAATVGKMIAFGTTDAVRRERAREMVIVNMDMGIKEVVGEQS